MIRRLSALFAGALLCALALGQSVPNGGTITTGQVWTAAQWNNAWMSKFDVTGGSLTAPTLNNPTITGGVQSAPAISNPTVTTGTFSSPAFTGTPTLNGTAFATSATVDTTNASNISSGALSLSRLNLAGSPTWTGPNTFSAGLSATTGAFSSALTFAGVQVPTYPQTAAEIAASVTPVNFTYPAGNILRYGAVIGSDASTAIQNSVLVAEQSGGNIGVYVPSGHWQFATTIAATSPVLFSGDGEWLSVLRYTGTSGDGIDFNFSSPLQGGGIYRVSIESGAGWLTSGFQGDGSTGIGVKVVNSNGKFVAREFGIHNFATAVSVQGSFYTEWSSFETLYNGTAAFVTDKSSGQIGGANWFHHGKISNFGYSGSGTASIGLNFLNCGGAYTDHIDITSMNNGVVVRPYSGAAVTYLFFDSVLADTSVSDNWVFDASNAIIFSVHCSNCWGGFSTNGAGLRTISPTSTSLQDVNFTGSRLRENGLQGWHHSGGYGVELNGTDISSNGKLTTGTYDGVLIDAGVSDWKIIGGKIGNYASGFVTQLNGINISAGASQNFEIVGVDLRTNGGSGLPITNGSTTSNWVVGKNLPLQAAGVNPSDSQNFNAASGASVAAASTVFMGANGTAPSAAEVSFYMGRAGVITGFGATATAAPGSGQSFVYTVFKNGSSTGMTGTISGGSFLTNSFSSAFAVTVSDQVDLQLVTSAGATATFHRAYITWAP